MSASISGHDEDCELVAAGWRGDMNGHCDCVQGKASELASAQARAAAKASAAAFARKPIDDAYAKGRADERAEWEKRLKVLEDRLAAVERRPATPPRSR